MAAYSDEFITKVLDANNLVDFISQHTQLKSTGSGLMGRCPFPDHQEKTPSFSVSETKQVYHCFGCHKKGNLFTFLKEYQGMSFPETIEFLAQRANIPIPQTEVYSPQKDQFQEKKKGIALLNKFAQEHFRKNFKKLPADHPVLSYVKMRGLTMETIEEFELGYAPPEWELLVNALTQGGYSLTLADEARLVKPRTQGKSGYYDLFRGRLMFPILNPMGEVVAFGGRILEKNTEDVKYLNSPETPVFTKGKILYGLSKTAKYIRTEDVGLVVEGYMDVVSLYQAGIKNCVASMGTALTPDQCRLLKRITRNVVALFDGDQAGQDAAERSLPIMLAAELYPKGLILPDGLDPDDYVKKFGSQDLQEKLNAAQDLFFIILEKWMVGYRGDATEKVKLADKLRPVFAVIPDRRLKELYLVEVADRMKVQVNWLRDALTSTGLKNNFPTSQRGVDPRSNAESTNVPKVQTSVVQKPTTNALSNSSLKSASDLDGASVITLAGASKIELTLMNLALKSRANFEIISSMKAWESITHEGVQKILKNAREVYGQDPSKFDKLTSLLVTYVDRPELLFSVGSHIVKGMSEAVEFDEEKETKLIKDCVRRVKENSLRDQIKKISAELKVNPTPEKLEQFQKIQKEMSSLIKQINERN